MTREEYFEIKDDCVKNGRIKTITEDDTMESLVKFFAEYKEKYLLLQRMTGDEWLLDFAFNIMYVVIGALLWPGTLLAILVCGF